MKNKFFKIILCALVIASVLCAFVGCKEDDSASSTDTSKTPITLNTKDVGNTPIPTGASQGNVYGVDFEDILGK